MNLPALACVSYPWQEKLDTDMPEEPPSTDGPGTLRLSTTAEASL